MGVMRIQRLNKVVLGLGNKNFVLAQHGLQFPSCEDRIKQIFSSSLPAEIPPVMHKSNIVGFQILPGPIESGELAIIRVFLRE
jgi:hypothetical protein